MRRAAPLLMLASCAVDLELGGGVDIACAGDGDCPSAWTCDAVVSRCIASERDDALPTLTSAALAPAVGAPGTIVELTFEASEVLRGAPRVTLGVDGPGFVAAGERPFRFTYVVRDDDTEGEAPVLVALTDLGGNSATVEAARLRIDTTAPVVTPPAWELEPWQTAVRPNDVVAFTATSEPDVSVVEALLLADDDTLVADVTAVVTLEPHPAEADRVLVRAEANLAGTLLPAKILASLTLADAGGNRSTVRAPLLPIDGEAPTNTLLSLPGQPLTTALTIDVHLSAVGATAYRIDGDLLAPVNWTAAVFPIDTVVSLSLADGTKTVTAHFRDGAGNEGAVQSQTIDLALSTDQTPPEALTASAPSRSQIIVSFSEPLRTSEAANPESYAVSPDLTISAASLSADGQTVTLVTSSQTGGTAYALTVLDARDLAGNPITGAAATVGFTGFGPAPDPAPPDAIAPTVTQPLYDTAVVFAWSAPSGAGTYTLEVAIDDPSRTTVQDFALGSVSGSPFSTDTPEHSLTLAVGSYHWRVRADTTSASQYGGDSFDIIGTGLFVHCASSTACDDSGATGSAVRPYRSISAALAAAASHGLERVDIAARNASGSSAYDEMVQLRAGVSLYGGWSAGFATRDPAANITTVLGNSSVTMVATNIRVPTVVDGLRVQGGPGNPSITILVADSDDSLTFRDVEILARYEGTNSNYANVLWVTGSGVSAATAPLLDNCVVGRPSNPGNAQSITAVRVDSGGLRIINSVIDLVTSAGLKPTNYGIQASDAFVSVIDTLVRVEAGIAVRGLGGGSLEMSRVTLEGLFATEKLVESETPVTLSQVAATLQGSGVNTAYGMELTDGTVTSSLIVSKTSSSASNWEGSVGLVAHGNLTVTNNTIVSGSAPSSGYSSAVRAGYFAHLNLANNILVTNATSPVNTICIDEADERRDCGSCQLYDEGAAEAVHANILVGCATLFRDADDDRTGADTATLLLSVADVNNASLSTQGPPTSAACNDALSTVSAVGFVSFPTDLRLSGATPTSITLGGLDTLGSTCGPARNETCGFVPPPVDFAGAARTCPTPPIGLACATGATSCLSLGGYEHAP